MKKLICLRDVNISSIATIYNTPKGLSTEDFIKNRTKYRSWKEININK